MNKAGILSELKRSLELIHPFFGYEEELLRRSYAPGKWSARQILAHLTDCEIVFQTRVRMIAAEPGCAITPFDQDKWERTLHYKQRSLPLMRKLFTSARESLVELVDALPDPLLGREGRHPEFPSYRAWDVVTKTATHTMHHYGQLEAIRDGRPWSPSPSPAGD